MAGILPPPFGVPYIDATGRVSPQWEAYFLSLSNAVRADFAPIDADYWVSRANTVLTGEQNMGLLASGYLKLTTAIGIATPSTSTTIPVTDISSGAALSKSDDTNVTLSLGGSPTTALLASVVLTLGWAGLLAVGRGGTGANNTTQLYTPTLTSVANVDAITAYQCQYCRVGAMVTVTGRLDVDATAGATATRVGISLPIASAFSSATGEQCAGTGNAPNVVQAASIAADSVNDRADMQFISAGTGNVPMFFSFGYTVI